MRLFGKEWVAPLASAMAGAVLFGPAICAAQEAPGAWKAGVARVDITPSEALWLAGYASRDHAAEGTLLPLYAKALALEDAAGQRAVLVTSDLLGFPKDLSNAIRDRLAKEYQLPRAQVILNSSHTHSGPVLKASLYGIYPLDEQAIAKIENYSRTLEEQIVKLVGDALNALAPARLASANGVARFAVNRRTNQEAKILDTYSLNGPNDHAVPVLKVERATGELLALVFGYACHATVLDIYQWSGDYPGFAQVELETSHPGATAMFFAGCGADQNPLPRRSVAFARQYGRELAAAVDRVLTDPMMALDPTLKMEYADIELALKTPPTRDELAKLVEQSSGREKRSAELLLAELDTGRPLPASYPYPVQVWRVGKQPIVALGGEVVVDYAILLKRALGRDLFVMGYSNDVMAYIPSLRVLKEGGYEGAAAMILYGLGNTWAEDVESRVTAGVRDLAARAGLTWTEPTAP